VEAALVRTKRAEFNVVAFELVISYEERSTVWTCESGHAVVFARHQQTVRHHLTGGGENHVTKPTRQVDQAGEIVEERTKAEAAFRFHGKEGAARELLKAHESRRVQSSAFDEVSACIHSAKRSKCRQTVKRREEVSLNLEPSTRQLNHGLAFSESLVEVSAGLKTKSSKVMRQSGRCFAQKPCARDRFSRCSDMEETISVRAGHNSIDPK
jgi:hypothetical protein